MDFTDLSIFCPFYQSARAFCRFSSGLYLHHVNLSFHWDVYPPAALASIKKPLLPLSLTHGRTFQLGVGLILTERALPPHASTVKVILPLSVCYTPGLLHRLSGGGHHAGQSVRTFCGEKSHFRDGAWHAGTRPRRLSTKQSGGLVGPELPYGRCQAIIPVSA